MGPANSEQTVMQSITLLHSDIFLQTVKTTWTTLSQVGTLASCLCFALCEWGLVLQWRVWESAGWDTSWQQVLCGLKCSSEASSCRITQRALYVPVWTGEKLCCCALYYTSDICVLHDYLCYDNGSDKDQNEVEWRKRKKSSCHNCSFALG